TPADGPAVARIKKAGKLVVLVDATFTPMEFKDEKGEIVGFDVDLAKELGKRLGVQVEFQNIAWDGIFAALKTNKGDMVWSSVTITDERKKEMAFSDPYYAAGQAILVPASNTEIKGPDDLKGKVVAVQIDTTGQEAAEKIVGIKEIKKLDGGSEACIMTEQGKADATIIDIMVAGYFAQQHPKVKLVSYTPFTKEDLGVAMRQDDADLVKKVNEILAQMKSDGTIDKTLQKWGMK
ncbi:MAG: basic amino acid ABC transporter substrate-binding protein, partial [Chloroflexota bacterium]